MVAAVGVQDLFQALAPENLRLLVEGFGNPIGKEQKTILFFELEGTHLHLDIVKKPEGLGGGGQIVQRVAPAHHGGRVAGIDVMHLVAVGIDDAEKQGGGEEVVKFLRARGEGL